MTVKVLVADTPSVTLTNIQTSGTHFSFAFPTASTQSYTVETATNLGTGGWAYYTNTLGDGGVFQLSIPSSQAGQFFRVRCP